MFSFLQKKKEISIIAPVNGILKRIEEVSDRSFYYIYDKRLVPA